MNLPDLSVQILYARVAWGVALAALALYLLTRRSSPGRAGAVTVAAAFAAMQWLPGPWSPAYWLGLAFQSPSALTIALCAVVLLDRLVGIRHGGVLPPALAAILAVAGGLLYLDASGWTALGIYFLGFGPYGAPAAALLIGSFSAFAAFRGNAVPAAYAVLAAVALFMLLRLPTGNLWDALIDPFLWIWSLSVCVRTWRTRPRRGLEIAGEPR